MVPNILTRIFLLSINHLFALIWLVSNIANINSFICTQLNSFKHHHVIQLNIIHLLTQLNGQRVLVITIWCNTSHLFAHSLNGQTVLFDPLIGPYQVLLLWVRVGLGAMVMKRYSTFPNDGLMSYLGYSLGRGRLASLQRYSQYILQPQPTGYFLEFSTFHMMQKAHIIFKRLQELILSDRDLGIGHKQLWQHQIVIWVK